MVIAITEGKNWPVIAKLDKLVNKQTKTKTDEKKKKKQKEREKKEKNVFRNSE